MPNKGFLERLSDKGTLVVAEGYLFELERRGYLKAGAFVPEIVVEHPELVKALYEEFVHAGSDVVLAFTYYGHRAKLQLIGREHDIEAMNRQALKMAREVANNTGTLMAGNICNTTIWRPDEKETHEQARLIFKEQIEWAVEGGADLIIAETYSDVREALLALQCIKQYGKGLPCIVNLMPLPPNGLTYTGQDVVEGLQLLEEAGADVVGLNCCFGPETMLPIMHRASNSIKVPLACLPVPYRTDAHHPSMQSLKHPKTGERSFPDLDMWLCARSDIADFTKALHKLGVQCMGLCCGNRAHFIRVMAEALGRSPASSRYSPDLTQHLSQAHADQYTTDLFRKIFNEAP